MQLSRKLINDYSNFIANQKDQETLLILKAIPDRLSTVIPGAIIIDEIMKLVSAENYMLSSYGVREGYLFNRILSNNSEE